MSFCAPFAATLSIQRRNEREVLSLQKGLGHEHASGLEGEEG